MHSQTLCPLVSFMSRAHSLRDSAPARSSAARSPMVRSSRRSAAPSTRRVLARAETLPSEPRSCESRFVSHRSRVALPREPRLAAQIARARRTARKRGGSRRAPRSARTLPRAAPAAPVWPPARTASTPRPAIDAAAGNSTRAIGCLQRPVRVVQVRRTLERSPAARRRRVVEVVRVKLAAQRRGTGCSSSAARSMVQLAAAGRETRSSHRAGRATGLRALRAEVRVDRRTAAAIAAEPEGGGGEGMAAKCDCRSSMIRSRGSIRSSRLRTELETRFLSPERAAAAAGRLRVRVVERRSPG